MKKITLIGLMVALIMTNLHAQNHHNLISISRESAQTIQDYFDPTLKPFYHGVASGDPLNDRVILWTRVTPDSDAPVEVAYHVSSTPDMMSTVASGTVTTDIDKDYTVKVDVSGLKPGQTYYYYFSALGANSILGRTRTAPEGDINQLRFAVVSCSNYQDGYFNAYERIAERNDIDAVIHLGDYIYEYETGGFGHSDEVNRGHLPTHEIISLMDYRIRYSYYKLDAQLRKAHQQVPFITIWDDHEFANNAWMGGAENHQGNEGDWNVRKANAYKAYFEWMPVRTEESVPTKIYRKIRYGNLVDLILLDTRMEGREKQKDGLGIKREGSVSRSLTTKEDYRNYLIEKLPVSIEENLSAQEYTFLLETLSSWAAEDLPVEDVKSLESREEFSKIQELVLRSYEADMKKSALKTQREQDDRQLLGNEQFTWLESNLKNSTAKWKLVANQVLFMPLNGIPLTDTWDGYAGSRDRLLNHIKNNRLKNVVFLTGDIHMTLASDLPTSFFSYAFNKKNSAAVEFVTPSITSSNLDEFIGISEGFLTWLVGLFNPHIKNTDLKRHGYFVLTVNGSKAQADWFYVDDVKRLTQGQRNGASWYVNNGDTRLNKASNAIPAEQAYGAAAEGHPFRGLSVDNSNVLVIGNYPNPAHNHTTLHYALAKEAHVRITLLDHNGSVVKEVIAERQPSGIYALQVSTEGLRPGVYLYQVQTEGDKVSRRLVVK